MHKTWLWHRHVLRPLHARKSAPRPGRNPEVRGAQMRIDQMRVHALPGRISLWNETGQLKNHHETHPASLPGHILNNPARERQRTPQIMSNDSSDRDA